MILTNVSILLQFLAHIILVICFW